MLRTNLEFIDQFLAEMKSIIDKLDRTKIDQIIEAHPRLTREAIQAALDFAAEALRADVVYPLKEAVG